MTALTDEQMAVLERQAAAGPLTDGQIESLSQLSQTPFGQVAMPQSAPRIPEVGAEAPRAPAQPLTDRELNQREEELYRDPSYIMTRDEYSTYWQRRREEEDEVGRFFSGLGAGAQGLVSLGLEFVAEQPERLATAVTDPVLAAKREIQTGAEAIRKIGVGLPMLYDWAANKVEDLRVGAIRGEAVDAKIREQLEAEGKFTGDREQDMQLFAAAKVSARRAGAYKPNADQLEEDEDKAFDRYVREKSMEQEYSGITHFKIGGSTVEAPAASKEAYDITGAEPYEATAMLTSIVADPLNVVPIGAGAMTKMRVLRRMAYLSGTPLRGVQRVAGGAADLAERGAMKVSDRLTDLTGFTPKQQAAVGAGAAGLVLATGQQNNPIGQAALFVGGVMPALRYGGAFMRRVEGAAGGAQMVVREAGTGGLGVARAEAAATLAANPAIPARYGKYFKGYVDGTDSTLKRVAMNPENPEMLRRTARLADNMGLSTAARVTDDVVSGGAAASIFGAPLAAIQPDAERAGEMLGAVAMVGGVAGGVGRAVGRSRTAADADIARMLADVEASGGDAAGMAALPHAALDKISGMQGVLSGKVDFVPLRADEYRLNADVTRNGGESVAGFFVEKDGNGRARIFMNLDAMQEKGAVAAHEIGHAVLTSNVLDGQPRADLRNLVSQQYGPEGVATRGREYAARLVDADIRHGTTGEPPRVMTEAEFRDLDSGQRTPAEVSRQRKMEPAERERLIGEKIEELEQKSIENGGDRLDWARDEIIAETFSGEAPAIDFRGIRRNAMFPRLAESMLSAGGRVLEVFGANLSDTGKLMDNPSVLFRDNPLFQDRIMQKRVREYARSYDQYLAGLEEAGAAVPRGVELARSNRPQDMGRSTHVKLRDEGRGVLENDFLFQRPDGTYSYKPQKMINQAEASRAAQIKTLYDARKFVPVNSREFGKRKVNGRETVGGPVLPAQFDLFTHFPKHVREFARGMEQSRAEGGSWNVDYNAIGTGSSGRYRVTNMGAVRAIQRETVPFGWQVTKQNHLLAASLDLNAFRASAMKAVNKGELGIFNNDMMQLEMDLKTYLANHRDGLPGEATIGMAKRDMLNGLIGTGTAVQRAANPMYYELNPRGSVRTWRVDRLNDAQPSGRTGYFFDYDKINNNRMPQAIPRDAQAMPDAPMVSSRGMPEADLQWDTYAERLRDDVESWSPARDTGKIDYEMQDVVDSFVDFARNNPQMVSDDLTKAFYRAEKPTASQRKKLNAALAAVGEPPRAAATGGARGQAMPDVGGQQTMIQRNPAGDYEPLGMLRQQKNGNWAVYTAPMMAANKDGTQTMLPPSKLAEYPTEAKARARAEKEFFTSLPLQDAKQYLGARERAAITEAQQRIAEVAKNNPEAARLEVTRDDRGLPKVGLIEDAEGNPVLDARGNQKFGAIYRKAKYGLREAPGLSKDEAKAVQQAADLMEADARRGRANPAIAKGIGWYGTMRSWLQQAYGATIELFGQLLGATSARTPVDTNFIQAREALQIFGRGGYDDLLGRFDAFVMQKKADADSGKMEADWRTKGGKGTFKLQDEYRKQVNQFGEVPLRNNGKKYNANSTKVLHALYGNWIAQTKGPKTPNFAGNLTGRTFKATVDVWAARNLRRLLYEGKSKRWRILPEQEQGVADVDFFFGQKVYDEVGKRMGIATDDLQALQWFNEKDIWEANSWTDKTGAEKSSFDKEAGKLSVDRYQVGLTTFQDAAGFDPAVQRAELTTFRNSVRAQEGLEAARVTESEGLYGNVVEPTFDAEFSVNRKGEVSPSIEPIVRQAIDTANRNKQNDVFISAVVEEAHPNARPMVEVGFKSAASRAEIDAVTAVFRDAGIDGFTVARNERGDVLGIRAQYVPEISARYDTPDHLDPAQFAVKSGDWVDKARSAIASLENQDNVSYRKEGHVSTNVYGIEEYGSVTPADILRSDARQELGRRRAILAAGTR